MSKASPNRSVARSAGVASGSPELTCSRVAPAWRPGLWHVVRGLHDRFSLRELIARPVREPLRLPPSIRRDVQHRRPPARLARDGRPAGGDQVAYALGAPQDDVNVVLTTGAPDAGHVYCAPSGRALSPRASRTGRTGRGRWRLPRARPRRAQNETRARHRSTSRVDRSDEYRPSQFPRLRTHEWGFPRVGTRSG
jgi:hypothetical protein